MSKKENQINWREPTEERCYYIELEFQGKIWVTKEMYYEYMREEWAEWKRNERSSRCQVSSENGGVKRCDKNCSECPRFRNGRVISINDLYDRYGMEIKDQSRSIIDKMVEEERNSALWNAISELDPIDQKIMKLFSEGMSERDISDVLGMPRTTISYRKKTNFDILRSKLKYFYK